MACLLIVAGCSVEDDAPADASTDAGSTPNTGCTAGAECDDGDPCTTGDLCDGGGACAGQPMACDDGLACTGDRCVAGECESIPTEGWCVHGEPAECIAAGAAPAENPCLTCGESGIQPVSGAPVCDDGDACTTDDRCSAGECTSAEVLDCPEDGDPCTDAACSPEDGCVIENNSAPCDDGDPCTTGDTCAGGLCGPGPATDCDDGDPCTEDQCDPELGCTFEPSDLCDDGDPCTEDQCDGGDCTNTGFEGPCEDGDPCTSGEACAGGTCTGGGPTDCDDDNVCTEDLCLPGEGCTHHFAGGTCSDGFSCTSDDKCVAGMCIGEKDFCADCPLPTTEHALKVVSLLVSADGNVGSALDIDDDPETCAPESNCSGGVDNALSILSGLLNGPLQESIGAGNVMYVTDMSQATFDGQPFPFAVLDANQTEASEALGCDFQAETCDYTATQFSFDPTCTPYFGLQNGAIEGTTFTGGGKGHVMTMGMALTSEIFIPITLVNARVQGVVTFDETGTRVVQATGIIGGAAPKTQLLSTIAALPEEQLPVDKEAVIELLGQVVKNDIDLDEDGVDDAASVGIRFQTIPANLIAD